MDPNAPIGFFDSGLGGLTVWRETVELLPVEDTIYLADSANAPYGEKDPAHILELARSNTRWLLGEGCKLIVVACNTATTNAIAQLRAEFPIPFIGIEPAIKPAALRSGTGKIGVLATRGTLASALFATTTRNHAADTQILEQEGEGLVAMIEAGHADSPQMRRQLKRLLDPLIRSGIDHLVLGCTHYPLLRPLLAELLPPGIEVVDCGAPVARQARAVLQQHDGLREAGREGSHRLYTNGDPEIMQRVVRTLGREVPVLRLPV